MSLASLIRITTRAFQRQVVTSLGRTARPKAVELCRRQQLILTQYRSFHSTNVNKFPFKLAILLVRPLGKLFGMIFGRSLRGWWQSVPLKERIRRIGRWYSRNQTQFLIGTGIVAMPCAVFYYTHLEEVPLVGRTRFVPLTRSQYQAVSSASEEMIAASLKDQLIEVNSSDEARMLYQAVTAVAKRILRANAHLIPNLSDLKWTVVLVDNVEANAFVVPGGTIYVYTGLFNIVANEHEMAMVLGHEMSHAILRHGLDNLTRATLLDGIMAVALGAIWCIMPGDATATLASWICSKVSELFFHLPFSRNLEREADSVGLNLLARACFDPRQAAVVWRKMDILRQILQEYGLAKGKEKAKQPKSIAANNFAVSRFITSMSMSAKPVDKEDIAAIEQKQKEINAVTKQAEEDVVSSYFSTHPSSVERYQTIRETIESGGTRQAAKEGRCDHAELSKPLPSDYDSPERLRTEILGVIAPLLEGGEQPIK